MQKHRTRKITATHVQCKQFEINNERNKLRNKMFEIISLNAALRPHCSTFQLIGRGIFWSESTRWKLKLSREDNATTVYSLYAYTYLLEKKCEKMAMAERDREK